MEASLDGLPLYEAISYTWGEFDKKFTVHVDEGEIQVPGNLYTLLKVRSSLWVPRLLWIDSISIDQTNDAEKKQQIQLMGDIYRKACVFPFSSDFIPCRRPLMKNSLRPVSITRSTYVSL
jgi:hypothetical protein